VIHLNEVAMRVLIVDDDPVSIEMLATNLREYGYDVTTAADGREAFELIRTGRFRLVVSDWQMPHMSGLELCREVRKRKWCGYIYFILLTSNCGTQNVVSGLDAGADDFLTKPFHPQELYMRLQTGNRILSLESRDLMIFAMAKLTESRDNDTGAHLERMREYSRILADELSHSPEFGNTIDGDFVQLLYLTAPLHDIGKVAIPDSVLLKPGKLTPEEFEVMKKHTIFGGDTLESVVRARPEAQFLAMAQQIALTHHEKWDGSGYPNGLKEEEIPLSGRIVALADVYDALTSKRVYKPAFSHETAKSIIVEGSGRHFDPRIVDAFLRREQDFIGIGEQFHDGPQLSAPSNFDRAESAGQLSSTSA
jgi:putative two-component system response regulator